MKYVILGLIFASICFSGHKMGNRYKEKEKFYYEFKNFLVFLKSEIGFFKKNLITIFDEFASENPKFIKLLENCKNFITSNKKLDLEFLSKQENFELEEFFRGLGQNDCNFQKEYIEKNLEFFNKKYDESVRLNAKYGVVIKKISILVGIMVCIILI